MNVFLHKKAKAFSIIEVMVVVTIVAVLGTIAISAYTKSLAKQMVVKAINATGYLRQAAEDYYGTFGCMPGNDDLTTGNYVTGYSSASPVTYNNPEADIASIAYSSPTSDCNPCSTNGACTYTGNGTANQVIVIFSTTTSSATSYVGGRGFLMRANVNGGAVTWECGTYSLAPSGTIDATLMPVSCYNAADNV